MLDAVLFAATAATAVVPVNIDRGGHLYLMPRLTHYKRGIDKSLERKIRQIFLRIFGDS